MVTPLERNTFKEPYSFLIEGLRICQALVAVIKIPDFNHVKEESFSLALSLKGFSPRLLGPMHMGRTSLWQEHLAGFLHLMTDRKHEETPGRSQGKRQLQGHTLSSQLLSDRLHLLKDPACPSNSPTSVDPIFTQKPIGISYSNHNAQSQTTRQYDFSRKLQFRIICLWMVLPTVGRAHLHQLTTKTTPHKHIQSELGKSSEFSSPHQRV